MGKRNSREEQLAFALRHAESGTAVAEVVRLASIAAVLLGVGLTRAGAVATEPSSPPTRLDPSALSAASTTALSPAQAARQAIREGRHRGSSRGVAMGYVQCKLVILPQAQAYEFLLYCRPPIHVGDPAAIGADLKSPMFSGEVPALPEGLMPVFWACGVTPQAAAEAAGIEFMITHAPARGFITDIKADHFAQP